MPGESAGTRGSSEQLCELPTGDDSLLKLVSPQTADASTSNKQVKAFSSDSEKIIYQQRQFLSGGWEPHLNSIFFLSCPPRAPSSLCGLFNELTLSCV